MFLKYYGNLQKNVDDEATTRPTAPKVRQKLQHQNSRTGSGSTSRPHTGYGKTRTTTEAMMNGNGK